MRKTDPQILSSKPEAVENVNRILGRHELRIFCKRKTPRVTRSIAKDTSIADERAKLNEQLREHRRCSLRRKILHTFLPWVAFQVLHTQYLIDQAQRFGPRSVVETP